MTRPESEDSLFTLPTAPSGSWEELTPNECAWIEFIRIISCGSDPRVTPARMRALREAHDMGRGGG
ncbi:MAG: hypothetical protein EA407_02080 [Rhodobacteraceae bacterium]|nr:MAG: hypothetical protein EA407_02080 [Paracoccaceae bacterium]